MDECISQVVDEMELAIKWQRPCIVVIVYQSELVFSRLQREVEKALSAFKQSIKQIQINHQYNDIPLILAESLNVNNTVFFVIGLRWGGGKGGKKAYQALNIHREHLIESQVRAIFWLTQKEATSLPRYAPDFWAFRHRVFEYLGLPSKGDVEIFSKDFIKKDAEFYEEGIEPNPNNFFGSNNLAITYLEIGEFEKALDAANQAIRYNPENPKAWLVRGNVFYSLGFFEDAIISYRRVIRLVPGDIRTRVRLGEIYLKWGNPKLASRYFAQSRKALEMKINSQ